MSAASVGVPLARAIRAWISACAVLAVEIGWTSPGWSTGGVARAARSRPILRTFIEARISADFASFWGVVALLPRIF